jgi:hypothetical protein
MLMLTIQNRGLAPCTLLAPALRAGTSVEASGKIIGDDQRELDEVPLPAADGPGRVVVFALGERAHLLADDTLSLAIPYEGGPYPGVTIRDFLLSPTGETGGRHGFTPRATGIRPG